MPRRNRRTSVPCRQITDRTVLSELQLADLARFAGEHLDGHAYAVWCAQREGSGDIVMSGSEHPATGIRFLSTGPILDPRALHLVGKSSDAGGNLAA